MTGFDAVAILILLASAAAGGVRGATRELITLVSFALAVILAMLALPFTAPLGRSLVDPDWMGSIFAAVLSFLVIYFAIRILGSMISKRAKAHPALGGVDRVLGVGVGAIRALVLLGAFHLVIVAAMPGERTPDWLTDSLVFPATQASARVIQAVLPGIGRGLDAVTPVLDSSIRRGFSDDPALSTP